MYTQLRRTHPRIGKAAYGAYFEIDHTGDYPDQQVDQILSHDQELGSCRACGREELRTHIQGLPDPSMRQHEQQLAPSVVTI